MKAWWQSIVYIGILVAAICGSKRARKALDLPYKDDEGLDFLSVETRAKLWKSNADNQGKGEGNAAQLSPEAFGA